MQRMTMATAVVLAILASAQQAQANVTLERFALADYVVVGKIASLENKTITLVPHDGARRSEEHQVALLKIERGIKGVGDLTHLRVAFVPSAGLRVGQEACFFLVRHFSEPLAVFSNGYTFLPLIPKDAPNFSSQVALCDGSGGCRATPLRH